MENTFETKSENVNDSLEILGKFEDCEEVTQRYFRSWIEEEGGWEEWLALGVLEEVNDELWPVPVPQIQTQFGNFVYDPVYQKWLDDEAYEEKLADHESNS